MKKLAGQTLNFLKGLPRYGRAALRGSRYSHFDLIDVDYKYGKMHRLHEAAHAGLIAEAGARGFASVLEVACGTGWNVPLFRGAGIEYWGMDISETAIAVAAVKNPENCYLNLGIAECSVIREGSFDLVYNSSMLEHIGYFREAIAAMQRLARKELWILFFEGLGAAERNEIAFHPYTDDQVSGAEKNIYGRKVVLQNHIYESRRGWYWNRYARAEIVDLFAGTGSEIEILDRTNRPYLRDESLLIVRQPGGAGAEVSKL